MYLFYITPKHNVFMVTFWEKPVSVVHCQVSLNVCSKLMKLHRKVPWIKLDQNWSRNSIWCRWKPLKKIVRNLTQSSQNLDALLSMWDKFTVICRETSNYCMVRYRGTPVKWDTLLLALSGILLPRMLKNMPLALKFGVVFL